MNSAAPRLPTPLTPLEQRREGRDVIRREAEALARLSSSLDASFCDAVQLIAECHGSIIVTGMGKAGLIGRKIAATLSSTGTRSHVLHPAEAVHGDLGCLHADDLVLALSHSGETEEVVRLLPVLQRMQIPLIAVTGVETSTLGREADIVLSIGRQQEAGLHGLAPSVSTTMMLALGDALALVLSRIKHFTPHQFAQFHPAGTLGKQLQTVAEVMRSADQLRIANENESIRSVFGKIDGPTRRTGAVILVDDAGCLVGLFTDSDLARLFTQHEHPPLDRPISEVMTRHPKTISPAAILAEAVELLTINKLSELPVIDADHKPLGLIDITDVIGLMPQNRED